VFVRPDSSSCQYRVSRSALRCCASVRHPASMAVPARWRARCSDSRFTSANRRRGPSRPVTNERDPSAPPCRRRRLQMPPHRHSEFPDPAGPRIDSEATDMLSNARRRKIWQPPAPTTSKRSVPRTAPGQQQHAQDDVDGRHAGPERHAPPTPEHAMTENPAEPAPPQNSSPQDTVAHRRRAEPDTRVGSPGGIAPPGSHRSRRDSLPSPGSCHPCCLTARIHLQWANMFGNRSVTSFHRR
jgi:hypothetical protein